MFMHPSTLLPGLALALAIGWSALGPGPLPASAALASAGWLVWALWRQALTGQRRMAERVAELDRRCQEQRLALQRCETARAAAEAEARAVEQRYLLALRGSQDGLWEWDLGSDRVQLSPRWKSMLGYDTQDLADDRAAWLDRVHAEDRPPLERALRRQVDGVTDNLNLQLRLLHKDGGVRHMLRRGAVLRGENGTPYRIVGFDTDVTPLKRVESILDAVAEGTAGAHGKELYVAMVRHFARALGVQKAFLAECIDHPPTRVRTLACWSAGQGVGENFEFALQGTPCEAVVQQGRTCFVREGVARRFARERGFESYLGMPIIASDGRVLGHLAFLDTVARGDEMLVDSVLRIFLARAACEIERERALARLAEATEAGGAGPAAG